MVAQIMSLFEICSNSNSLVPVNVTVLGNRFFADVIKVRSYWLKMDPNPMLDVLERREKSGNGDIMQNGDLSRNWHNAAASHAALITGSTRCQEGARKACFLPYPKRLWSIFLTPSFQKVLERINVCCSESLRLWYSIVTAV
jgi:hypothetical protein